MNKLTNLLRKISLCFVIMACALTNSLIGANNYLAVHAISLDYKPTSVGSVSTSFSTTNTSFPANVSNWTLSNDNSSFKRGIISTNTGDYSGNYAESTGLTFNPGSKNEDENNVLMINAGDKKAKTGYTSSTVEFEKRSFYHISIDVYTVFGLDDMPNSFASVKINGENFSSLAEAYYSMIQTYNSWQTVDFYIASNNFSNEETTVDLRLGNNEEGSYGAVFFDNFVCEQISNNQYFSQLENYNGSMNNTVTINVAGEDHQILKMTSFIDVTGSENYIDISAINPDFENGTDGWTRITTYNNPESETISGVFNIGTGSFTGDVCKTTDPTNAFRYNNKKALLINNVEENSYGYKSQCINIPRNRVYALTIEVKTSSDTNATINLVQENITGSANFTPVSVSFDSISTSAESTDSHGGWETYTFLVKGNFDTDSKVYLELFVGTSSTQKGFAWFDNIILQEISFEDYSTLTDQDNTKTANLAEFSETLIRNGLFNDVTSAEIGGELTPNLWTVTTNAIDTSSVSVTVVDKDNYRNVLKVENKITTATMITSEAISIDKGEYYLLTFDAKVERYNNAVPYITVFVDEKPLYTLSLSSSASWMHYDLGIKNKSFDSSLKVAICLGGTDDNATKVKGIVYLDNFKFVASDSDKTASATHFVNFLETTFSSDYDKVNDTTDTKLHNSLTYSAPNGSTNNTTQYGILDLGNFDRVSANNFPEITENPKSNNGNYVYIINSDTETYFYVDSNTTYSLSAQEYYKLTVSLKTINIAQDTTPTEENAPVYGAFIGLSGIEDAKITGIRSVNAQENYGYDTYTLYVYCASNVETSIRFGIGQESSLTRGALIIDSIRFETIDSSDYESAEKINSTKSLTYKYADTQTDEETKDEEITPEEPDNKVDFNFLVIPTLITGVALIVAITGVLIRKYGHKRSVKIKNQFDKADVMKSHNLRGDIAQKEQYLAELKAELETLEAELEASQPDITTPEEKIAEAQAKIYELENEIGVTKENIAQTEKDLKNLKKQLERI